MPAYKDEKRKTWYCSFYFTDWTGVRKKKKKSGFKREKDAKQWETDFLKSLGGKSDIPFLALVENYEKFSKTRLKPTTYEGKVWTIDSKILPIFKNMRVCDITPLMIQKWQDSLIDYRDEKGKSYSQTYLKTLNNQMSAIMNHAVRFYGLATNPCSVSGSIGKSHANDMKIWTLDDFEQFIGYVQEPGDHLAFNVLFWSGIREGELLALTWDDFIQKDGAYWLNINKNYAVVKGQELILTPKNESSIRVIVIPKFIFDEADSYRKMLYGYKGTDRLFYFRKSHLLYQVKKEASAADLEHIRIHDLRHSHASMLIEMGYNILVISKRLGHDRVQTTWDTYAHLYPDKESILGSRLDQAKVEGITINVPMEEAVQKFALQVQAQYGV